MFHVYYMFRWSVPLVQFLLDFPSTSCSLVFYVVQQCIKIKDMYMYSFLNIEIFNVQIIFVTCGKCHGRDCSMH